MVHVCLVLREQNTLGRVTQPPIWIIAFMVLKNCHTFVALSATRKPRFSIHMKTVYAAKARHSPGNREKFPHHVMGWNVWNTNININLSCRRIIKHCSFFILKYEGCCVYLLPFQKPAVCFLASANQHMLAVPERQLSVVSLGRDLYCSFAMYRRKVGWFFRACPCHLLFAAAFCVYFSRVLEQPWTV